MSGIPIYQVDAFCDERPFSGNPAAVCLLDDWPEDESVLLGIAGENNLSETAFLVALEDSLIGIDDYQLRWFTPKKEVDLCGHATLAAASVVLDLTGRVEVRFSTRSGTLIVAKTAEVGVLRMELPAQPPRPCPVPEELLRGLNPSPNLTLRHDDYIAVYPQGTDLTEVEVDFVALAGIDLRGVCITSLYPAGSDVDFASRFFAPGAGINEDPVTGSAHSSLVPYWSGVLGKTDFVTRQVSARGGTLRCQNLGDRIVLEGRVRLFLKGEIYLEEM